MSPRVALEFALLNPTERVSCRGWVVATEDAKQGYTALCTASETLGVTAEKALLLSTGGTGLLGVAHRDASTCRALAQLTTRLWQLERHFVGSRQEVSHHRATKRRRTTL